MHTMVAEHALATDEELALLAVVLQGLPCVGEARWHHQRRNQVSSTLPDLASLGRSQNLHQSPQLEVQRES